MPERVMEGLMMDGAVLVCLIVASLLSVPLTMVMEAMHRHFVVGACAPLSPAEPAPEMAGEGWLDGQEDERQLVGIPVTALLAHGALAGAACLPLTLEMPVALVLGGVASGFAAWAGSRVFPLAVAGRASSRHPGRGDILIAAHGAHALWGAVAAVLAGGF